METSTPPSKASGKQSPSNPYSVEFQSVSGEERPSEIVEQIASTRRSDQSSSDTYSVEFQSNSGDDSTAVVGEQCFASTSNADNPLTVSRRRISVPAIPIAEYMTYSVDTLAQIFNKYPVKPLPIVPQIKTEVMIAGMFHTSLIDIAHHREEFDKQMDLITDIRYQINNLPFGPRETFLPDFAVYSMFNPPPTASFYDWLDYMFYMGQTKVGQNGSIMRYRQHMATAAACQRSSALNNQQVHKHIAECWNAGSSIHFDYLGTLLTEREASFLEHISIAFLAASPNCRNIHHGNVTLAKFKSLPVHITWNAIVTMGCAFMLSYYFANRDYFHTKRRFVSPNAAQNISGQSQILTTFDSAVTLATNMPVPAFSLLENDLVEFGYFEYAYHLFVSLFTMPPKYTRWYLLRSRACIDLLDCKDVDFRFDILEAINTVLGYRDFTFSDCIKWARSLHYHLFTTIVNAANKELEQQKRPLRFEAPKNDAAYNEKKNLFISSAAALLSVVVDIKDKEGKFLTTKHALDLNKQMKPSEFTLLVPTSVRYIKTEKFVDFRKFQRTLTPETTLVKDPRELTTVVITPIEPFWDVKEVRDFIRMASILRQFSCIGSGITWKCGDKAYTGARPAGREFSFPYFRWAQRFIQFV